MELRNKAVVFVVAIDYKVGRYMDVHLAGIEERAKEVVAARLSKVCQDNSY